MKNDTKQAHSNPLNRVLIGVVMGSQSDWDTMQETARILEDFQVGYKAEVVSGGE